MMKTSSSLLILNIIVLLIFLKVEDLDLLMLVDGVDASAAEGG